MSDITAPLTVARATARAVAVLGDSLTMIARCVRLTSRHFEALLMSLMLPVMLMLLFVYLFGGAIHTGISYVNYVVPGGLVLCTAFGASMTAVSVSNDMNGGIIDRLRSLDVSGAALPAGHVAASVARNLVSTGLVLGLAVAIGFRPSGGQLAWLAAGGVLLLFVFAMSWLSAAIGLVARSAEAASGFTFFISFLPYPSSAFVPIQTMPWWLHGFAEHQPVSPVIETMRELLLDRPIGSSAWQAVAWSIGLLVVSVAVSGVLFRRRVT